MYTALEQTNREAETASCQRKKLQEEKIDVEQLCSGFFKNNLLKINFNGKLRAEISSAVLCPQRVTCMHKSKARAWHQEQLNWQHVPGSQAGMGARQAGRCSPQSVQLWAGSGFWDSTQCELTQEEKGGDGQVDQLGCSSPLCLSPERWHRGSGHSGTPLPMAGKSLPLAS